MAIQTTIDTKFGTIQDAYCRIAGINWNEPSLEITLSVKVFASRDARVAEKEPLEIKLYYISADETLASSQGGNVISFAYRFIKSKDEDMAKGTDV